jgi:hypothetical protein
MSRIYGLVACAISIGLAGCSLFDSTEYQPGSIDLTNKDAAAASMDAADSNAQDSGAQDNLVELTFEVVTDAPVSALTVRSEPTGIDGAGVNLKQSKLFPRGTTVSLFTSGDDIYRYSGDCAGKSCILQMNAPKSVKMRVSAYNYMFLTNQRVTGDLGGASGADRLCNDSAAAAGLPGKYIAWLATPNETKPSVRLGTASGWIRPDGKPLLRNSSALGSWQFYYMPVLDEYGNPAPSPLFWSGINELGNVDAATCDKFLSSSPSMTARVGIADTADRFWAAGGDVLTGCNQLRSLMCVGVDRTASVDPPVLPAGARIAFVTAASILPGAGLAAFDKLCQTEATNGNLNNPTKFRALVAPGGTATPMSRFTNPSQAPWYRKDGVRLAESVNAFFTGKRDASVSMDATALFLGVQRVLTGCGAAYPAEWTSPGGGLAATCKDWKSSLDTDVMLIPGVSTRSRAQMGFGSLTKCSEPQRLYCLED